MQPKYTRFLKNLFWILMGGASSKIISFIMLPFYTQWLSPEEYGVSDIVTVYSTLLMGISTLCIAEAMFVFPKNVNHNEQKKYFSTGLLFTFVLLIIVAFIFSFLKYLAFENNWNNSFISYIWYIYILMVTNFFQVFTHQFSCAINAIKIYSFTGVIQTIGIALFAILLIPQYGVKGYIFSFIISNIIAIVYNFILSKSYLYFSVKAFSWKHCTKLIIYSIPLIPNNLMWWAVSSLNRPILEEHIGLAAIGIYAIANKLPSIVNVVFGYLAQSWQITVFEEFKKNGFSIFFNKMMKLVFLSLIILASIITFLRNQILNIITAPEYKEASLYIPLISLGLVFSCMGSFMGTIFAVQKKSKYYFYSSIWGAIIAILFNFLLIPYFGVFGAVFSSLFSFIGICMSRFSYLRLFLKITHIYFFYIILCIYIVYLFVDFYSSIIVGFAFWIISLSIFLFIYNHHLPSTKKVV